MMKKLIYLSVIIALLSCSNDVEETSSYLNGTGKTPIETAALLDVTTAPLTRAANKDFDNGDKTFELTTSLDNINNICNLKELLEVLHQNNNYEQGKSMKGFINNLMLYLLTTLLISVGIFYLMCYFGI